MRNHLHRASAILGVASLGLLWATMAHAAPVPINFTGTQQSFTADISVTGDAGVTGSGFWSTSKAAIPNQKTVVGGPFVFSPSPQSVVVNGQSLGGDSDPISIGPGTFPGDTSVANIATISLQTHNGPITSTTDLDLNILDVNGGGPLPYVQFSIDRWSFTTTGIYGTNTDYPFPVGETFQKLPGAIYPALTLDVGGTLQNLVFTQTGAWTSTSYNNILHTGTFSVDGNIFGNIPDLAVTVSQDSIALGTTIPTTLDQALALTGSYKLSGPATHNKVELDGSISIGLSGISLSTSITLESPGLITVNVSIDANAAINVSTGYHLEAFVVPEPGSVVLFCVGLVALVPFVRYRLRKRGA